MTITEQKSIKPKLGLLELAKNLGNVSQACKVFGYSRDSFSCFKELYETGSKITLMDLNRKKPNPQNQVHPDIEEKVIRIAIYEPACGQ